MDNEKWLFEKGCFLGNWNDDSFLKKKETPIESATKLQSKDLDTLYEELDEIKAHLQDVRQRGWQLSKLIEFHNNGLAKE